MRLSIDIFQHRTVSIRIDGSSMIRIYRDIVHFTELDDKAWTSFEFESLAHGCDPTIKKRICFVYVNTTGPKAFVWFVYLQDGQP
jgi:hypothetical protein